MAASRPRCLPRGRCAVRLGSASAQRRPRGGGWSRDLPPRCGAALGLGRLRPGRSGLSIPRGRRYRRPGVRTHESTDLDRCGTVVKNGIRVTDPARTVLDVGRYVGQKRLARVAEGARRADLVTWSALIACLAAHARRGRPGIRRLRAVILAGAHREEITDTDMELLVLGLITEAGLPEPTLHHRVHDAGRFVAEVDLAYPRWHIAIECDGDIHLDPAVRERDLARQNDLTLVGWTVLRFSWTRVQARPEVVVAEVRAAIESARRSQPAARTREDHM